MAERYLADDSETVLFHLRGLPTFPDSELSKEPLLPEPAFSNTFGPPTLLHEVYIPPSRARACPECVYVFLEQARVLQNASQWDAALDKLETARRIWVDKRVWPILAQGLDPFVVRAMAVACLKREATEDKVRTEWEAERERIILNRRKEREAKEKEGSLRGGAGGLHPNSPRSKSAEVDDEADLPPLPPALVNKSEVQLAREEEEQEAKRLCALSGSATPEEELEFYIFLWLSIASVYQSCGDDKNALLHTWRARVAIADHNGMIQESMYNKELSRKLRRLRALAKSYEELTSPGNGESDVEESSDDEYESEVVLDKKKKSKSKIPYPLAAKLKFMYRRESSSQHSSASSSPSRVASRPGLGYLTGQSPGLFESDISSSSLQTVDIHSINLYESDGEDDGGNPSFHYAPAVKLASQQTTQGLQLSLEPAMARSLKAASAKQSKQTAAIAALSSPIIFNKSTTAPVPTEDDLKAELQRLGLSTSETTQSEAKDVSFSSLATSLEATIPQSITDLVLWSSEQSRLCHQKLELIDVLGSECSPVLASIFSALGVSCARLNEIPLALACFRAAKDIRFKCIPPSSVEFADVGIPLNNIGVCLTSLQRPREALAYFFAAMETFSPRIESTHPRVTSVAHNIERVQSLTDLVRLDMDALRSLIPVPGIKEDSPVYHVIPKDGSESGQSGAFDPSTGIAGLPGTTRQIKLTQYQRLLVQYNTSGGKKTTVAKSQDVDAKKKGYSPLKR